MVGRSLALKGIMKQINIKALAFAAVCLLAMFLLLGAASTTRYAGKFVGVIDSTLFTNSSYARFNGDVYLGGEVVSVGTLALAGSASVDENGNAVFTSVTGNGLGMTNVSSLNTNAVFNGTVMGKTNAVSAWPTAPAFPGAYAIVSSNGVVYILTSNIGATWTATNKLAP